MLVEIDFVVGSNTVVTGSMLIQIRLQKASSRKVLKQVHFDTRSNYPLVFNHLCTSLSAP